MGVKQGFCFRISWPKKGRWWGASPAQHMQTHGGGSSAEDAVQEGAHQHPENTKGEKPAAGESQTLRE